jgi:hypothetical protein
MTVTLSIPVIASLGVAVSIPYARAGDAVSFVAAAKHVLMAFACVASLSFMSMLAILPIGVVALSFLKIGAGSRRMNGYRQWTGCSWLFLFRSRDCSSCFIICIYDGNGMPVARRAANAILRGGNSLHADVRVRWGGICVNDFGTCVRRAHASPPPSGPIAIG